jgi:BolA protein
MSVQSTIENKIRAALAPAHLEVVNESHMHSVPPGSESHFRLVIVSKQFEGAPRVRRHQMVNGILKTELKQDIHALSMQTLTGAEWEERGGRTMASPPCHGGGKAEGGVS